MSLNRGANSRTMDAISLRTDAAVPRNGIGHSLGIAFYPGTELMTSDGTGAEHAPTSETHRSIVTRFSPSRAP